MLAKLTDALNIKSAVLNIFGFQNIGRFPTQHAFLEFLFLLRKAGLDTFHCFTAFLQKCGHNEAIYFF